MAKGHEALVGQIAERSGVDHAQAAAVLEAVGLKSQLGELERGLGADALRDVQLENVRLSFRIGRSILAV